MNRLRYFAILCCAVAGASHAGATGKFWHTFEGSAAPSGGKRILAPEHYLIRTLDQPALYHFLETLPSDASGAQVLSLPAPDGKERSFRIWQSSVMEAPLQVKYSQIRTFTAVATDDASVTAKLDITPQGFHAMVFDGSRSYFVDPYADQADGYYIVYYRKDYVKSPAEQMPCNVTGKTIEEGAGTGGHALAQRQNGAVKKTYRLALACTGEYAVAVAGASPSKVNVLGAMVTIMNRVNGVYERELAVTMTLIGNTDTLIYLNGGTDPYNNSNIFDLLDENQTNTTALIGSANYDIGHIFSTSPGGGLATLNCVCDNDFKAAAATGSPNPVGDPYAIDYVAHEMGHQFGAHHTFNKCINEDASAAYEPGGGSTIMAYAGICGTINNLQLNSDAYFHTKSLAEISDYITIGLGSTCPVTTAGGALPSVASVAAVYTIPYRTPFELEAPQATAASSDTLSYCWEQWDLGDLQQNESGSANFTAGPSFRSFFPVPGRWRVFPRIDSVVRNVSAYKGERLPAVARGLDFKLTVRNITNGIGAFNSPDDSVHIDVINTGQPFEVISPNSGTFTAYKGQSLAVAWTVAQTNVVPVNTPNVDIFLSVDGGYTYPFTLATAVPNSGSATITLPDTVSTKSRIKVKGSGNIFFDISNADFKIVDTTNAIADIRLDREVNVYPNPATDRISLAYSGNEVLDVVLYSAVGQKVWSGILRRQLMIPAGDMARGLYFLELRNRTDGGRAIKRITLR